MIHKAKSPKAGSAAISPVRARRVRSETASTARTLTEDEADVLFAEKHKKDKRYPLRDVIKENGDIDLLDS